MRLTMYFLDSFYHQNFQWKIFRQQIMLDILETGAQVFTNNLVQKMPQHKSFLDVYLK